MASIASTLLTGTAAFAAKQQPSARRSRAVQPCRAMADEEDRKLSFESNKRSALGFTESDSAGQTNIFAVEPKSYVAGSSSDNGSSTVVPAAIAGVVALGVVAAGLLYVNGSTTVDLGPTGDFKSLSEYKAAFEVEARAAAPPAAPAVADE